MSLIPPITPTARERIAREFDDRGPEACLAEVVAELRRSNPELLDIARRCAASLGDPRRIMLGFGMFYRLLSGAAVPGPLPRVSPEARDRLVRRIDLDGPEAFTMRTVAELERDNPELLRMAHAFASRQRDYLGAMQGLVLFYRSLLEEAVVTKGTLH